MGTEHKQYPSRKNRNPILQIQEKATKSKNSRKMTIKTITVTMMIIIQSVQNRSVGGVGGWLWKPMQKICWITRGNLQRHSRKFEGIMKRRGLEDNSAKTQNQKKQEITEKEGQMKHNFLCAVLCGPHLCIKDPWARLCFSTPFLF